MENGLGRINFLFARRASLPSLVDPEPLIRICAHIIFNSLGETRGVLANIPFFISRSRKLYCRFKAQTIFRRALSQERNPGTTAASVRKAIRARPEVVEAGMPKKSTNTLSSSTVL